MATLGTSKFLVCEMARPDIGQEERGNTNEAILKNEIGQGRFIEEFEQAWATYNSYAHGVSCSSGTAALHLAIKASGAKKILIPNFTMAGTAWAALYEKLDITYYGTRKDLPLADHNVDPTGYDAIVFAHIYGRRAYPIGWVKALKEKHPNLIVIDDMAEAHGIFSEGDIACYSFYSNKILTTGEGGMCLTNDESMAKEMRLLASMYFDNDRTMIHPKIGHNYRMTNLLAGIGLAQVNRVEDILLKRAKSETTYDWWIPDHYKIGKRDVLWYYDIKVPDAGKVKNLLKQQGVDSRRFFYPMSLQPWGDQTPDDNALYWYKHGLLLPVYNTMLPSDIKWIAEILARVCLTL